MAFLGYESAFLIEKLWHWTSFSRSGSRSGASCERHEYSYALQRGATSRCSFSTSDLQIGENTAAITTPLRKSKRVRAVPKTATAMDNQQSETAEVRQFIEDFSYRILAAAMRDDSSNNEISDSEDDNSNSDSDKDLIKTDTASSTSAGLESDPRSGSGSRLHPDQHNGPARRNFRGKRSPPREDRNQAFRDAGIAQPFPYREDTPIATPELSPAQGRVIPEVEPIHSEHSFSNAICRSDSLHTHLQRAKVIDVDLIVAVSYLEAATHARKFSTERRLQRLNVDQRFAAEGLEDCKNAIKRPTFIMGHSADEEVTQGQTMIDAQLPLRVVYRYASYLEHRIFTKFDVDNAYWIRFQMIGATTTTFVAEASILKFLQNAAPRGSLLRTSKRDINEIAQLEVATAVIGKGRLIMRQAVQFLTDATNSRRDLSRPELHRYRSTTTQNAHSVPEGLASLCSAGMAEDIYLLGLDDEKEKGGSLQRVTFYPGEEAKLLSQFWRPTMLEDPHDYVSAIHTESFSRPALLHPGEVMEIAQMEPFEPRGPGMYRYLLVMADCFSQFLKLPEIIDLLRPRPRHRYGNDGIATGGKGMLIMTGCASLIASSGSSESSWTNAAPFFRNPFGAKFQSPYINIICADLSTVVHEECGVLRAHQSRVALCLIQRNMYLPTGIYRLEANDWHCSGHYKSHPAPISKGIRLNFSATRIRRRWKSCTMHIDIIRGFSLGDIESGFTSDLVTAAERNVERSRRRKKIGYPTGNLLILRKSGGACSGSSSMTTPKQGTSRKLNPGRRANSYYRQDSSALISQHLTKSTRSLSIHWMEGQRKCTKRTVALPSITTDDRGKEGQGLSLKCTYFPPFDYVGPMIHPTYVSDSRLLYDKRLD
ncbi:uncharacterized protein MYCFIDRAFT_180071 [Pseudocercospora fijiensis CIRAD86]|uniref:Uncharacterized protein n=1 Tax=Pseudocercospora fijiensis (strain CIRAD86) TaxID=383855 RepID=M2ZDM2_PSEFD|nr:uncharacterized protein MYCFIDRAFT_180071 [Pseudocercospora fijiensis CIRAD86]EME77194.1 hypothetical protein MYCFIDRAFT_180071 [Pseudocercospora fijiensis CIRAD86]